jgi:8-oxo-dGTP pyrophosphatase MutT (NUDIX family)
MEIPLAPNVEPAESNQSPSLWVTLGGGIHEGESVIEAARREVREETGLTEVEAQLVVWHGQQTLETAEGPTHLDESFVLARTGNPQWSSDGWSATERKVVRSLRWWTLSELRQHADVIRPPRLAERLEALLAGSDGDFPKEIELEVDP